MSENDEECYTKGRYRLRTRKVSKENLQKSGNVKKKTPAIKKKKRKVEANQEIKKRNQSKRAKKPSIKSLSTGLGRVRESTLCKEGFISIVGVDEAGRGPLAGPVVAAACIIPPDVHIDGIDDSKKISEENREILYEKLISNPKIRSASQVVDASRIDEINILQASMEAMRLAVEKVSSDGKGPPVDYILVDGPRDPSVVPLPFDEYERRVKMRKKGSKIALPNQKKMQYSGRFPDNATVETVVKGDSRIYSIAAASLIAKVERDRIMVKLSKEYPEYNLDKHKGYPTAEHKQACFKHGASPIHRLTFAPLKNMSEEQLMYRPSKI
eukprot:g519.t1